MKEFEIYTSETAPDESMAVLGKIKSAMGFVPNMLGVFAESPAVLEGSFVLFGQLGKGSLTAIEQQIVAIAVSRENKCHYCVAAHSTFAVGAKIPAQILSEARSGKPLSDSRLEILRITTLRVLSEKGWLSAEDQDAFFEAGYNKAQLLEVIAWVGLKTITNYINHVASTPVDEAFAAQKW